MITAAALALAVVGADPRIPLVQLQLENQHHQALQQTEREMRSHPEAAREMGLGYLQGHLLERLGRPRQAADAFAQAMAATPRLEPYSRYRLAVAWEGFGHPEVATGLISSVITSQASAPLLSRAIRLLAHTISEGGDCRVITHVNPDRLPPAESRAFRVVLGTCALRAGDLEQAGQIFLALLQEGIHDEPERQAAEQLAALQRRTPPTPIDRSAPQQALPALIGLALHQHRDFDRAISYLGQVVAVFDQALGEQEYEIGYARVRALFWQQQFDQAAHAFGWLARRSPDGERQAQAFYQQGRSYELAGRWRQAEESFRAAYRADPDGEWADGAVYSLLRLKWLTGNEQEAEKLYALLASRRSFRSMAARAALFFACSELVNGRTDRVGPWLDQAARVRDYQNEVDYWRGRLRELEGTPEAAIASYLEVLRRDPFHPLAEGARRRLAGADLAEATRARGRTAAAQGRSRDLYDAWLLLGDQDPTAQEALKRLIGKFDRDPLAAPFLALEQVPVEAWPLWLAGPHKPEEMLLALGVFDQGAPAVEDNFPVTDAALGYTGSDLLAQAGEFRSSILRAEILSKRVPSRLPEPLLHPSFRKLLHPLPHRQEIFTEAQRFGVDPLLLAAVIREESRFDAYALSAASARGLTQFVQPTAARIGQRIGLGNLTPEDMYRPQVAIALGAAYLSELRAAFVGRPEMAVAAYNAGEAQARLWSRYCFSTEPEEYFTKVGFRQTRDYLSKVLGSWARYRSLYRPEVPSP